jgi:hypothetical protein
MSYSDSKSEPTVAVGLMTKSNETVTIPGCQFGRKFKNVLTAFAITIKRGEQNTKTSA